MLSGILTDRGRITLTPRTSLNEYQTNASYSRLIRLGTIAKQQATGLPLLDVEVLNVEAVSNFERIRVLTF